jgi:hypothetical protein
MEVSGQTHAPAALSLGKELPLQLNGRLCGPRVGLDVLRREKSLASAGIQTLYHQAYK